MSNGADKPKGTEKINGMTKVIVADLKRSDEFLKVVLEKVTQERKRTVYESDFKELFLPFFRGQYVDDKEKTSELLQAWVRVAGSVFDEVELLDEGGDVIAVVPSIYGRDTRPIKYRDGRSWNQAHHRKDNLSQIDPSVAGSNFVKDAAVVLGVDLIDEQESKKHAEKWVAFLAPYGGSLKKKSTVVAPDEGELDFDYE